MVANGFGYDFGVDFVRQEEIYREISGKLQSNCLGNLKPTLNYSRCWQLGFIQLLFHKLIRNIVVFSL
jgi:hypothetical protein